MGIARKEGAGVKACQDGLEHFFSTLARLTERGGGLKLFWQCPYRTNTFQKGASLNADDYCDDDDGTMVSPVPPIWSREGSSQWMISENSQNRSLWSASVCRSQEVGNACLSFVKNSD